MAIQQLTEYLRKQSDLNVRRRILPSHTVDVANGGGGYELYAKIKSGTDVGTADCGFSFSLNDTYTVGTLTGSASNIINSAVGQFILDSDLTVSGLSGDQKIALEFWPTGSPPEYRDWTWQLVAYPLDGSGSNSNPCHHYIDVATIEYGSASSPTVTNLLCDPVYLVVTEIVTGVKRLYWDSSCNAIRYELGKFVNVVACDSSTSASQSCTNVLIYGASCLDESTPS